MNSSSVMDVKNQKDAIINLSSFLHRELYQIKHYALARIKLKMVNSKVKQLSRVGDYSSRKSNNNDHSFMNISDFKPLDSNYNSVKIVNYETYKLAADIEANQHKKILQNLNDNFNPDFFLENWMIRQQPQIILSQNYPKSDYCLRKVSEYNEEALEAVRKSKFSVFCKKNIKPSKSWFFKPKNPLQHRYESISQSLTYIEQHLEQQAIDMFGLILKAGMQNSFQQPSCFYIHNVIEILVNGPQQLQEEGYLQLIKQNSSGKRQYLQFLCCLASTIKVSMRLYLPLLNYILEQSLINTDENSSSYYSYIFYHIIKNFSKPRKNIPSVFELYCYSNLLKVPIIVDLPKQKTFFVQSYTTVTEFIEEIVKFYNLDSKVEYLIYIQGKLLQNGILLDQMSKNKDTERAWIQYLYFKGFKATIVLKNMIIFKQSARTLNIMYNYLIAQYLRGLYKLKSLQITRMAGLIMFSESHDQRKVSFSLDRLIPKRILRELKPQKKQKIKKNILKYYCRIQDSKIDARKKALKILQCSKAYMTHFFFCEVSIDEQEEIEAVIGLKWNKMILLEPLTGRSMRTVYYNTISQWGASQSEICFKIEKVGALHCHCLQVAVMGSIFQSYLDYVLFRVSV